MSVPSVPVPVSRSMFVTVVAIVFIVLAGAGTFVSVMQNVVLTFVFPGEMFENNVELEETQPVLALTSSHMRLFFFLPLIVFSTTLVAAIGLYKRKNWARILFVGIMALGIADMVFGTGWFFIRARITAVHAGPMEEPFKLMMVVTHIFVVVFCLSLCGVLGWIIKRLTSDKIRHEFMPGCASRKPTPVVCPEKSIRQ